jgi:hypothetical protein
MPVHLLLHQVIDTARGGTLYAVDAEPGRSRSLPRGWLHIRPRAFYADETDLLRRAMEEDPAIRDHSLLRAEGGATRISLWNRAGDSV